MCNVYVIRVNNECKIDFTQYLSFRCFPPLAMYVAGNDMFMQPGRPFLNEK